MIHLDKNQQYVYNLFNEAQERNLMFVNSVRDSIDTKKLHFNDRNINSFISNNYLGLEHDERIKKAAIEGIEKYGVFSSFSRSYTSFSHYVELEDKLETIYKLPTLIINNVSLGHFAYLPLIVGQKDIVILDQFVHKSVSIACQYLKGGGIDLDLLRHNEMSELEEKIINYSKRYKKVWYLTDSVFSMQGDTAPFSRIENLLNKYECFNIYVDDAHGMSWIGENGKGFCLHNLPKHEKMHIITSLNKGFGATSAAMIFPDKRTKDIVHKLGLPIIFSSPSPHFSITAASAIADIHLSPEIYEIQSSLGQKIEYLKRRAKELKIPMLNPDSQTPIGFIVLGNVEAMAQFGEKMHKRGFMMSIASYPSVPLKYSGFRITITNIHTIQDIENLLVNAVACYEELEKEGVYNPEVVWRNINQDKNKINS